MADVAQAASASKPLLYHYFPTKSDLYLAAVRAAAAELREATTPSRDLAPARRVERALEAHLDWVEANAVAYRAILQGGVSSHPEVQAIIEGSRADVVARLAEEFGFDELRPEERVVIRGWVGFLEGVCLDWLAAGDLSKPQLVRILTASLAVVEPAVRAGTVGDDQLR